EMKKALFLSLTAIGFAVAQNATAQKTSDLEILMVSPTENQMITHGSSFDFSYRIVNNGDSAIVADDTFYVGYSALGINLPGVPVSGHDIAVGDTSDIIVVTNLTHDFETTSDSSITACAYLNVTMNNMAGIIDTNQTNDSACVTFILEEKPVSIYSVTNFSEQFNIYPNPTQGNVNIAITGWKNDNALTVSIMDITGRVIMTTTEKINASNKNIQLNTAEIGRASCRERR